MTHLTTQEFKANGDHLLLSLLAPSMGLIKTANAVLKRIQTSLKENGHPYEFEFVQDMDNILSHCQKISPLVSKQPKPNIF